MKIRLGSKVDTTGTLADGRRFEDINGLRQLLLQDEDTLARNMARQLLIYATGAGIRFSDREAIDAIVTKTNPTHHGLRSLVQAVVASITPLPYGGCAAANWGVTCPQSKQRPHQ